MSVRLAAAAALLLAAASAAGAPPPDSVEQRMLPCMACHGDRGRATRDGYYPRIAGKPAGYLYNQLLNFRDARRSYAMMNYLVDRQQPAYLREMAEFFAAQHPPYPPPQTPEVGAEVLARGRALVMEGDAAKQVPACGACHGERLTGVLPATPGLLGLSQDYLVAQLGAWRLGNRHAQAPDCMGEIVRRLAPEALYAAAAWLAAQPVPADPGPAPALPAAPPLDCGSVPDAGGARP